MKRNIFLFNKFLEKEGYSNQFWDNFKSTRAMSTRRSWDRPVDRIRYFETVDPAYYINDAFSWENSPGGYRFWQVLSDNWIKNKHKFKMKLNMLTKTL